MIPDRQESIASELLEVQRTLGWMDMVIGSISDAVYVTDTDSRLVFSNQYFSNLLDIPRVFLLGQLLDDVFSVLPAREIIAEFKNEALTGSIGADTGIYEWENREGEKLIFRISSQLLKTTDQTVYLAQNITHEYELSRMKNNFIDLASHQLRTPMTAVMTYAHLLNDGFGGDLNPGQQQISSTIIEASERMIKLVNDLLTITRTQNETQPVQKKKTAISNLFKKIHTEVQATLQANKLTFEQVVEPDTLHILSDSYLLHEVFSNLVVNAIQYTPPGGTICIRATLINDKIQVEVSDTGIGIPEQYMPQLFKQFSRAENAVLAYPDGTGLGLYMIKLILEKIGGSIHCTSNLNEGTTFTVILPAK